VCVPGAEAQIDTRVQLRSGLALSLFRAGSFSVASAAQVEGLPLRRFLEILSSLKIPVVECGSAELQEDLANARSGSTAPPERRRNHDQ
jgi:predicted HTH domain antitoxin